MLLLELLLLLLLLLKSEQCNDLFHFSSNRAQLFILLTQLLHTNNTDHTDHIAYYTTIAATQSTQHHHEHNSKINCRNIIITIIIISQLQHQNLLVYGL